MRHHDFIPALFLPAWALTVIFAWRTNAAAQGTRPILLEFAWTAEGARAALQSGKADDVAAALTSLGWDYGFLVAYGAALAVTLAWVWRGVVLSPRALWLVVAVPVLAAACDLIENSALVIGLAHLSEAWDRPFAVAGLAASVKFLLIGLTLALIAVGALRHLRQSLRDGVSPAGGPPGHGPLGGG